MSLEEALAKNTAAVEAQTAAIIANTEQLSALNAGREAALQTLTEKGGASTTPAANGRGRKKAEPAATTAAAEPAATVEPAVTFDQLKAQASAWLGKDDEGRADRATKLKAMLANFGAAQLPDVGDDDRVAASYFIKRWDAGLEVDFNADYDFNAPLEAAADADDDGDDLLG